VQKNPAVVLGRRNAFPATSLRLIRGRARASVCIVARGNRVVHYDLFPSRRLHRKCYNDATRRRGGRPRRSERGRLANTRRLT